MLTQVTEPKHVPAGTGSTYWGPGDAIRLIITGAETNGALFVGETIVPPGGGPPPHIHTREDESFYVLEGTVTIQVGERIVNASAGDFVLLPCGLAHSFRNTGAERARMLVTSTPAGLEGFFAEAFDPAADDSATPPPPTPQLFERIRAAAPKYGLLLLPPA